MRRYDDSVEVRRGMVAGIEGPEQFLWRGRLWKVSDVLAHWVETGPWWQSRGVHVVLGADDSGMHESGGSGVGPPSSAGCDLVAEREVWRVEAARGFGAMADAGSGASGGGHGVFDLVFDWSEGSWQLVRCMD